MARVLWDAELVVAFHCGYIGEPFDVRDDDAEFSGQTNGLLGAAAPNHLALFFGLHTGREPLRIEWSEAAPAIGSEWDDVVEASWTIESRGLALQSFDQLHELEIPALGTHRARFSARGLDEAWDRDYRDDDEPAVDRYLLQFWPARPAPDAVVRQTSEVAAVRHREVRGEPHPVSPDALELKRLEAAFAAAPVEARIEALAQLAETVVRICGLDDMPEASEVARRVRRRESRPASEEDLRRLVATLGAAMPPIPRTGDAWMHSIGRRRFQAGMFLQGAVGRPVQAVISNQDPPLLGRARFALADDWPAARDSLLQLLPSHS